MAKQIYYNVYDTPPLPRNRFGFVNNSTLGNVSSTSIFGDSDFAQSIDISNVSGSTYIPDFIGATDEYDGVHGLVPAPTVGQNHSYFLYGDGSWTYDAPHAWLKEFPYDGLTPTGLGIDGDFNVTGTLSTFNLEVEGRAHFWELVIDKVRATGGTIFVSPSSFILDRLGRKIVYSTSSEPFTSLFNYRPDIRTCLQGNSIQTLVAQRIYMRNDDGKKGISGTSDVGDMVRCKTFNMTTPGTYHNVNNKDYWTFIVGRGEENYSIKTDDGTFEEVSANYIDLAWYFVAPNSDIIPIGSTFTDHDYTISYPLSFTTYDLSVCKDKSQLTLTGEHNYEVEYPEYDELIEFSWYVLSIRGMSIPDDINDSELVGTSTNPVINLESVTGATPYTSPDYHIEKYSQSPYTPSWMFGYGVFQPSDEDEIACFGSLHDTDRRNAVTISASTPIDPELKAPAIAQYAGIDLFGVSISRFRITAISYGRNIFKGDFEVLAENGQYTNILTVTADQTQNMVSDAYNGAISYTTQRADEISTYVYNSYAYSLSYTSQTAEEIKSTVVDLDEDIQSEISQMSDRIDLTVTKDDMEMVGIHLDGVNSTVDIVGSLSVKQNGVGDIDTIQVFDENEVERVEITPESIPAIADIGIDEMRKYYEVTSSSYSATATGTYSRHGIETGRNYYTITDVPVTLTLSSSIGGFSAGDTLGIRGMTFYSAMNIRFKKESNVYSRSESFTLDTVTYRLDGPNGTVSSGTCTITGQPGSFTISDINNISLSVSGDYTLYFSIRILASAEYRFRDNQMPSTPYTFTITLSNSRMYGHVYYLGGSVQSFMQIGTDGFYYTGGNNKYLYSSANEFELRFNDSLINVNQDRVKILNKVNTVTASESNAPFLSDESIVYANYGGGTYPTVVLPTCSNYGYGRTLTIVGFIGLTLNHNDYIWLFRDPMNKISGDIEYTDKPVVLHTSTGWVDSGHNYYGIKNFGVIQFMCMNDGWHVINII